MAADWKIQGSDAGNQRKYHKKMLKETPGSETEQSDKRLQKFLDLRFNFSLRTRRHYKKPEPGDFPEKCLPPDPIAFQDSFPTGHLNESFILWDLFIIKTTKLSMKLDSFLLHKFIVVESWSAQRRYILMLLLNFAWRK